MAVKIMWEKDIDTALAHAHAYDKPILLFFHNPE